METRQSGRTDLPLNPKSQSETRPQSETASRGSRGQSVREVMTRNPQTIGPAEGLQKAAKLMLDHDCGAIPVVEGNKVTGIITDRDIVIRVVAQGRNPGDARVSDAMTKGVETVRENDSIDQVMEIMQDHKVRRVPVVNDQGLVVGIIAQADIATEAKDEDKVARTVEEISEKSRTPQR